MSKIGVGIIGSGAIALANHIPGFSHCPEVRVVALCDANPDVLAAAGRSTGISALFTEYKDLLKRDDVHAVVIATPNHVHAPIALAAVAAGKHILCEKPLAMQHAQAMQMLQSAEAAGLRHMTAFTYRFVPAMRYMAHLIRAGHIGKPYHFRAQRFQDWGTRDLGWRQTKALAATGELGDMLSHRIDYAHLLVGPIQKLVGQTRRFIDQRGGRPADADDWVAVIAQFVSGATGALESSKLATGRGEGGRSHDLCEVNGSEGTLVYGLSSPNHILAGRKGGTELEKVAVPREFLKHPASTRDPNQGDPLVTFRYDQNAEFIDAILAQRDCTPSFKEGAAAQSVMDAILQSEREARWVEVVR